MTLTTDQSCVSITLTRLSFRCGVAMTGRHSRSTRCLNQDAAVPAAPAS
jgi:hypothetical protein